MGILYRPPIPRGYRKLERLLRLMESIWTYTRNRKAIREILKETEIIKERNKPPENGFCINKRLLSRNLVSTLRNPVFPKNLARRRIIGLDDDTEDESDDQSREKHSSSKNRFADDDFIYDARDYFNPEKYREIVAYRNKKRQRQESYERKRFSDYVSDSFYMPDIRRNNYYDDNLQYRESQDYVNEELQEPEVVDEKARIELLTINRSASLSEVESTNNFGTCSHRKRKRHKSKKAAHTESQQRTRSRKSKHRQDKLACTQEDKDMKCGKCKNQSIEKARHKKKKGKKKKKSACTSNIEFGELNQLEVEDFSNFRSDRLRNITSPYSSYLGNEDSGSSMQRSICYDGKVGNHRMGQADCNSEVEQLLNGSDVSYEGSSLVSAKYLNELYFRTRQNSDNGESSIHSFDSVNYTRISSSDLVLDSASYRSGS